MKLASAVH